MTVKMENTLNTEELVHIPNVACLSDEDRAKNVCVCVVVVSTLQSALLAPAFFIVFL